jgi:hypothetical protein
LEACSNMNKCEKDTAIGGGVGGVIGDEVGKVKK